MITYNKEKNAIEIEKRMGKYGKSIRTIPLKSIALAIVEEEYKDLLEFTPKNKEE